MEKIDKLTQEKFEEIFLDFLGIKLSPPQKFLYRMIAKGIDGFKNPKIILNPLRGMTGQPHFMVVEWHDPKETTND